uniref:Uncharacterized protein n=1 Tax=Pipistrellus kuhlii TaxID=59472 RepID=A0A7J8B120_PIPKU|nr:hypothetical protein mPipKuh1_007712 [Pipistrellus kuhlii]
MRPVDPPSSPLPLPSSALVLASYGPNKSQRARKPLMLCKYRYIIFLGHRAGWGVEVEGKQDIRNKYVGTWKCTDKSMHLLLSEGSWGEFTYLSFPVSLDPLSPHPSAPSSTFKTIASASVVTACSLIPVFFFLLLRALVIS